MGITPDLAHPRPGASSAPTVRARPGVLMMTSLTLIVALIAVAAYLTWVHYQPQALICAVDGGCHTVQSSRYAMIGPVPVALLGLGLAVALLGLWAVRWLRPPLAPAVSIATVGLLVGAVTYYGWLTHVELNVLDAICQWCVLSALLTVALLVVEAVNVWRLLGALPEEER